MSLPVIAIWLAFSAAALPTDAPAAVALKLSLASARSVNGTVDIRTIVDLADIGKTAEDQARSYFSALLGDSVQLTVVGVDHTGCGTVVHFKQVVGGNLIESTHAMAVIKHSVLHYASMRLVQPQVAPTAPQAAVSPAQAAVLAVAANAHGAPRLVWRVPARTVAAAWSSELNAGTGSLLQQPASAAAQLVTK